MLFDWLKIHFHCKMKKQFSYNLDEKSGQGRSDQTAHYVQSDLDLYCPETFLVPLPVRKELT